MSVGYGTQVSSLLARDVAEDESVKPGATYSANFAITGIQTALRLGWENDAIIKIRNELESQGAEIVYIGIDTDKNGIDVQWKYPITGNAQAAIPMLLVYGIVIAVIFILAIWLVVTLVGAVKEISTVMTDNPAMIPVVYGAIAIGGLIAIAYLYKQIKGD